jgi:hypothetical protein
MFIAKSAIGLNDREVKTGCRLLTTVMKPLAIIKHHEIQSKGSL